MIERNRILRGEMYCLPVPVIRSNIEPLSACGTEQFQRLNWNLVRHSLMAMLAPLSIGAMYSPDSRQISTCFLDKPLRYRQNRVLARLLVPLISIGLGTLLFVHKGKKNVCANNFQLITRVHYKIISVLNCFSEINICAEECGGLVWVS